MSVPRIHDKNTSNHLLYEGDMEMRIERKVKYKRKREHISLLAIISHKIYFQCVKHFRSFTIRLVQFNYN